MMTNAPNNPMQYAALVMNFAMPSITVAFVTTMKMVHTAAMETRLIAIFETVVSVVSVESVVCCELPDSIGSGTSVEFGEAERDDSGDDSGEMIASSDIDID